MRSNLTLDNHIPNATVNHSNSSWPVKIQSGHGTTKKLIMFCLYSDIHNIRILLLWSISRRTHPPICCPLKRQQATYNFWFSAFKNKFFISINFVMVSQSLDLTYVEPNPIPLETVDNNWKKKTENVFKMLSCLENGHIDTWWKSKVFAVVNFFSQIKKIKSILLKISFA